MKFYIGERILPKFWNKDSRLARETYMFKEYLEFNSRLDNIKVQIKNAYRQFLNDNDGNIPEPQFFLRLLKTRVRKLESHQQKKKTFMQFFEQIIYQSEKGIRMQAKGKPITESTIKTYRTVLKHLKEYSKNKRVDLDFDTIDLDFYSNYSEFLIEKDLTANSIGKHFQIIKLIMNEATDRGLNKNLSFKSKRFAVLREEVSNIYLSLDELDELAQLDLSNRLSLDRVRDLFLIGAFTGLRFSDCFQLRANQIKNGFIELVQVKTDDPVVIPVHPVVQRIIRKYDGDLPKSFSNQKTNDMLKEIAKLIASLSVEVTRTFTKGGRRITQTQQKWELVCTHTQRRSFCTNEYLQGTDNLTIMKISGHKTEKSFLRYICVSPKEHAERLRDRWNERNNHHISKKTAAPYGIQL